MRYWVEQKITLSEVPDEERKAAIGQIMQALAQNPWISTPGAIGDRGYMTLIAVVDGEEDYAEMTACKAFRDAIDTTDCPTMFLDTASLKVEPLE